MNKKLIFPILLSGILLAGCFGANEELEKGITLYEKGDIESLTEAKQFFVDYLEKNPDDKDARKYNKLIDEAYTANGQAEAAKKFEEKDYAAAYEIAKNLSLLQPDNQEVIEALAIAEKAYNDQKDFDFYAEHTEKVYKKHYELVILWNQKVQGAVLGSVPKQELITTLQTIQKEIGVLRLETGDNNFIIKTPELQKLNNDLFSELVQIESQVLSLLSSPQQAEQETSTFVDRMNGLKGENFNEIYVLIQSSVSDYVDAKDNDGKPIRNIKNTLQFSEPVAE